MSQPPQTKKDPLLGATLGGKYELLDTIAVGGTGRVYRARHTGLARTVAIKLLHSAFQDDPRKVGRFNREAQVASRIQHPNVVEILDFGQEGDGGLYIVMEHLEGRSLQDLIRNNELTIDRAINIMGQVLAGVSAAHDAGVIHRDLTPNNVMVLQKKADDGELIDHVKVLDFGIAKQYGGDGLGQPMTMDMVSGTPEFMSPEQCRGQQLDTRSDVYACGCLLYAALAGRAPFTAQNPVAVVLKQVGENADPPSSVNPDVPQELDAVCMKALAKSPDDRFPEVRAFRSELRRVSQSLAAGGLLRSPIADPHSTEVPIAGIAAAAAAAPSGAPSSIPPLEVTADDTVQTAQTKPDTPAPEPWPIAEAQAGARTSTPAPASTPTSIPPPAPTPREEAWPAQGSDPEPRRRRGVWWFFPAAVAAAAVYLGLSWWGEPDEDPVGTKPLVGSQAPSEPRSVGVEQDRGNADLETERRPAEAFEPNEVAAAETDAPTETAERATPARARPVAARARAARRRRIRRAAASGNRARSAMDEPSSTPAWPAPETPREDPSSSAETESVASSTTIPAEPTTTPATTPSPEPPTLLSASGPTPARPSPSVRRTPAAPAPVLRATTLLSGLAVQGPMPATAVRPAIASLTDRFGACYRAAATRAKKDGFGRIRVSFQVDVTGGARRVRVNGGRLRGLNRCVGQAAQRIVARPRPSQSNTVSFALEYRKPAG